MATRRAAAVVIVGSLGALTLALTFAQPMDASPSRSAERRLAAATAERSAAVPARPPALQSDFGQSGNGQSAIGARAAEIAAPESPVSPDDASPDDASLGAAFEALARGAYDVARRNAEVLATRGDAKATHLLGYLHEKGLGVEADVGRAMVLYGEAAMKGNVDAQVSLGLLAMGGGPVERDYERAAGWFRLAADKGDGRAMARLGSLYADGLGVGQDHVQARRLFAAAAERNDADGLFFLALADLNGMASAPDPARAADLLARAVEHGHAEAAYHLGLLFDSPLIGPPDPKAAVAMMQTAAGMGFPPAMTAMGLLAHRGDGPGLAADWFEMAAAAGDLQGRFLFAVALARGDGRPADPARAAAIARDVLASEAADAGLRSNAEDLLNSLNAPAFGAVVLRD